MTTMKLNLAISALLISGASAEAVRGGTPQRKLTPLNLVTESPAPGSLGLCEGDCDKDTDCQPAYHCFKREPTSDGYVPWCSGGEKDDVGKDYCTHRVSHHLWLLKIGESPTRDDGTLMVTNPLGQCEGDCDTNADCQPGLRCFHRDPPPANPNAYVPSCDNAGGDPAEDYCIPDFM